MKWVKLIISIVVGVVIFFVVFNKLAPFDFSANSLWGYSGDGEPIPPVPFIKQVFFFLYMVVIMSISTGTAVAITEKYKLAVAIIVGVISGILVLFFVSSMFLNISKIFMGGPIYGAVIGWLSFKYSGQIIQKIKSRSKDLTSEFDD